jgi:RNA polymerase sigma-70 factor (ECF subfamily)
VKTLSKQNLLTNAHATGQMPSTHWSIILQSVREESSVAHQALDTLCRAYWYPLYAYLRREGRTVHEAQDLTQGFFAHLLSKHGLVGVGPKEGMRFRSWLLSALRHYARDEWRKAQAERRGGRTAKVFIDAEEAEDRYEHEPIDSLDPAKLYERKWAMELLQRVLAQLEKKYAGKGKQNLFTALQPFVMAATAQRRSNKSGHNLG